MQIVTNNAAISAVFEAHLGDFITNHKAKQDAAIAAKLRSRKIVLQSSGKTAVNAKDAVSL
jgi:hypothetical protein